MHEIGHKTMFQYKCGFTEKMFTNYVIPISCGFCVRRLQYEIWDSNFN